MLRLENVLKMSSKCLEDVLAWRLEDAFKMFWRRLGKASWRRLENVLKTSWRRLEDIWPRRVYRSWSRCLQDIFWRRMSKANIFVLMKTSWRRFEDVFWRRRQKTSSRRLHQDKCLLGIFRNSTGQENNALFSNIVLDISHLNRRLIRPKVYCGFSKMTTLQTS